MARSRELLNQIKSDPNNPSLLDELVLSHSRRNAWEELYRDLISVLETGGASSGRELLSRRVVDAIRRHGEALGQGPLAAELKLRLARTLMSQPGQRGEALVLASQAWAASPQPPVGEAVVALLQEAGELRPAVRILKQLVAREKGAAKAEACLKLGQLLLSLGEPAAAREQYVTVAAGKGARATEAKKEAERLAGILTMLGSQIAEMEKAKAPSQEDRASLARLKLSLNPDDGEALETLLEVYLKSPRSEEVAAVAFWPLLDGLERAGRRADLGRVFEAAARAAKDPAARVGFLLEKARVLLAAGDKAEALGTLRELREGAPGGLGLELLQEQISLLGGAGLWSEAMELLGEARQATQSREEEQRILELEAALAWNNLGDLERAEKLYRRIRSIDPKNRAGLLFYEEYHRRTGDPRKLYSALSSHLAVEEDELERADLLREMAKVAEEIGSPERAADALKKLLAMDPGDQTSGEALENLYLGQKKWHSLVDLLASRAEAAQDRGDRLGLLWRIAEIYADAQRLPVPEMEINTLKKIAELDPEDQRCAETLVERFRSLGRWSALAEALEKLTLAPSSPTKERETLRELATIWADKLKNQKKAMEVLEKLVDLHPGDLEVWEELAGLYRSRGLSEKLYEALKEVLGLRQGTERTGALEELARLALDRLKKPDEAVAWLRSLGEANPKDKTVWTRLSGLYAQTGDWSSLAALLEERLAEAKRKDERLPLLEELGDLYLDRLEDPGAAKRIFDELLATNAQSRKARDALRRILLLQQDWNALRELFSNGREWTSYTLFLEEQWKRSGSDLARGIGRELAYAAMELMGDKEKAERYLHELLGRVPDSVEDARALLERFKTGNIDRRLRALSVLADHAGGAEAEGASLDLARLLEEAGKSEESHQRTLALLEAQLVNGNELLFEAAVERAETADSLAEFVARLDALAENLPDEDLAARLVTRLAAVLRERLRDLAGAVELLQKYRARLPHSVEILEEMQRLFLAMGDLDRLEATLEALCELPLPGETLRDKLLTLARLHEEALANLEKAAGDYRRLLALNPEDEEAHQGLVRVLEEGEDFAGVVEALEQRLPVLSNHQDRVYAMLRASTLLWRQLRDPGRCCEVLGRLLAEEPGLAPAVALAEDVFEKTEEDCGAGELLKVHYRAVDSNEALGRLLVTEAARTEDQERRLELFLEAAEALATVEGTAEELYFILTQALQLSPFRADLLQRCNDAAEQSGHLLDYSQLLHASLEAAQGADSGDGDPRDGALLLARIAQHDLKDLPLAAEALRQALRFHPDEVELMDRLEAVLEESGQPEELLELLRSKEALVFDREQRIALHRKLAELVLTMGGREEEAMEWLATLLTEVEEDQEAADRLEELYAANERWEDLADLLSKRLAWIQGPQRSLRIHDLAQLQMQRLGKPQEALDLLEGLLEDPGFERATVADSLTALVADAREQGAPAAVVARATELLMPLLTESEDWERLALVLGIRAETEENGLEAGAFWLRLSWLREEHLGDGTGALEAAAQALKQNPADPQAALRVQTCALGLGQQEQALKLLKNCCDSPEGGQNPKALELLADLLIEKGREKQAVAYQEQLLELAPDEPNHYRRLLETYSSLDRTEDRCALLERYLPLIEDPEERQDQLALLGHLQVELGRPVEAEGTLRRLLGDGADPENPRDRAAMTLLEELLAQAESWFELVEFLRFKAERLTNEGERVQTLLQAARLQEEKLENPDAAVELFKAAWLLERRPELSASLERLLLAVGRFQDLAEVYDKLLEDGPAQAEKLRLLMALASLEALELGRVEGAVGHLGELILENPADRKAGGLLTRITEEHPDQSFSASELLATHLEAVEDWKKLAWVLMTQIERFPGDISVVDKHRALAELYDGKLEDSTGAFYHTSCAFRLEPASERVHEALLEYAEKLGAWDELFDIYIDVLVELSSPEERNNLRRKMARLYDDKLDDFERAEMLYKDILDDDSGDKWARERLGSLYEKASQWEKLVELKKQTLELQKAPEGRIPLLYEMASLQSEKLDLPDEAMDTLEAILALDPEQKDAYRSLEFLHFGKDDPAGAAAVIKRELTHLEDPEERRESRLRLVHLLMNELGDLGAALEEVREGLGDGSTDEAVVALLEEQRDKLELVEPRLVETLVELYRGDRDRTVLIFQWAAAVSASKADKLEWFEKVYQLRLSAPVDHLGAYAVTKIQASLDPDEGNFLRRAITHAEAAGQTPDLEAFLQGVLASGQPGDERLAFEMKAELARLLWNGPGREAALPLWTELKDGPFGDLAEAARAALLKAWRTLERVEEEAAALLEGAELLTASQARAPMLEAVDLLLDRLDRKAEAAVVLGRLAEMLPEDDELQDRLESVLTALDKREELENLLRRRIAGASQEEGLAVRLRLAALLLEDGARLEDGGQELADLLRDHPDNEEAQTLLEALFLDESHPAELRQRFGSALLENLEGTDQYDRTAAGVETLLTLTDDDLDRLALLKRAATLRRKAGDDAQAFEHLAAALELAPGDRALEEALEEAAGRTGDRGRLKEVWIAVSKRDPGLEAGYLGRAASLAAGMEGAQEETAGLYEELLGLSPANGEALSWLEQYYSARGDNKGLVRILETRADSADEQGRTTIGMRLGDLYLALGETPRAVDWYNELLTRPAVAELAFEKLGAVYQREEQWEWLRDLYQAHLGTVKGKEKKKDLLARLAMLEEQFLAAHEDALNHFNEILGLDPKSSFALNGLRRCFRVLDLNEELTAVNSKLVPLTTDPEELAELHRERAYVLIHSLEDGQRALEDIDALLELAGDSEDAYGFLLELVQGENSVAAAAALRLRKLAEERGNWQDALSAVLVLMNEGDGKDRFALAREAALIRLERLGDPTAAMSLLAAVLDERGDLPEIWETVERVAFTGNLLAEYAALIRKVGTTCPDPKLARELSLKLAMLLEKKLDRPGEAAEERLRIHAEHPEDLDNISALEHLLLEAGRYPELAELYESLLSSAAARELRLSTLLKLGFLKEDKLEDKAGAIEVYRDVLGLDLGNAAAVARLDALMEDPVYGPGVMEILEPVHRASSPDKHLRILLVRARESRDLNDRARYLVEAAGLTDQVPQAAQEVFSALLATIPEPSLNLDEIQVQAEKLAETLGGWLELAQALDRRLGAPEAPEDLAGLRRLALIYEDKCGLPARAELKLRQILLGDSQDDFALARLSGILEKQPQRNTELKETLEQMALSSSQERRLEALEALVRLGRQTGDGEGLRSALQRLSEMEPERGELLTELESLLGGLGDWSALADLLERLASMGSQEDQRKRRLRLAGVLKEKLGRPDRAAAILEDLIADQPQDFAAVGALVGLLGDEGNWRRAAELLLASVSQDNLEESLAHLDQALGLALEKVGDRGLGRRILERALELHPGHLENLLKLVDLREAEEDFEGAAALWDQVAQATEEPEARAQALHMGTRLLARTSVDPAELLARVGQTLALKPDHFDARRLALEVLERQGRWNEAFDAWMALAAEDQANRGTALAGAARIKLQELGDAKGALEILESRGARAATTLELRGLLLDALEKAGRHQDLIDRLAEELVGTTDQSRRSDLCRRTAVAYRDGLGQVDKFLSWIEEAHKAEENPAIVEELLTHYRGVGDGKRVLGLLQWKVDHLVSRRKMKEVPGLLLEVAAIHESLGDPDRALEDLRRAEGVDASNLTVLMNLARLLTNLGEQDELLRILQILVVRIGELPDEEQRIFVYLALARATLASGQKSKAKQYLSRLLAIRKYHQEALDLLETIQKS